MNTIREIEKINQLELDRGIAGTSASWHSQFANSAWCYVGNLDHQLTEGDVLCIMSQYGEVDDIHLVREEDTGKSRGFGFIKYEDARSCVLAVDNFCGATILGRSLRVDHVEQYRLPKKLQEKEDGKPAAQNSGGSGHAYEGIELENNYNIHQGMDLFAAPKTDKTKSDGNDDAKSWSVLRMEKMKRKEERQQKRLEKEERRRKREERRERHEEKKRKKRARKYDGKRKDD